MKKQAAPLLFTVSGLRGIAGKSVSPALVFQYARAFGELCGGGKVLLARDTRPSGERLKLAVSLGLLYSGCKVIDIGIAPTPTLAQAVRWKKAAGGIAVTASHNPIEWNGLKFFDRRGRYIGKKGARQIQKGLGKKLKLSTNGKLLSEPDLWRRHIQEILKLKAVQKGKIRRARLKVVIDAVNGAGFTMAPELLAALRCRIIKINCQVTGTFPRGAEPVPKNLTQLERAVKKHRADIGLALDPDADRLAIVSEKGKAIGEEYTLALAALYVLKHNPGPVVVNLSTSKMVEDVAKAHGCRFERTPVGEANVSNRLEKLKGVLGGEGNGGVIFPGLHYTRDSLVGMGLVLSLLVESKLKVSDLVKRVPKYFMIKEALSGSSQLGSKVKKAFPQAKIDTQDGLRFEFPYGWVHLRKSNTEPVVRIMVEAKSQREARELLARAKRVLKV